MPRKTQAQKRTAEFVGLCQRHRLALSQAQNASENGYPKLAAGVLRQAEQIQIQIEQHVREERYHGLLSERSGLVQKLHTAVTKCWTEKAEKLGQDLAVLDRQIEAV